FSMGNNSFTGNLLVLLNMIFYAMYLVLIKPLAGKYHTSTIMKWVSLFGLLFILPFCAGSITTIPVRAFDLQVWLSLAFIIILNTFVAYLLINFALQSVTATSVSFYSYLQPVIASIMSVSLGFESITWPKIAAALLIFSGVYLVNRKVLKGS
ncbi:MAG TPA: DMT family transporter, partial [Bacteroidales bacterium]|nr:DMT family transporter [Bacteroidales bacterium]